MLNQDYWLRKFFTPQKVKFEKKRIKMPFIPIIRSIQSESNWGWYIFITIFMVFFFTDGITLNYNYAIIALVLSLIVVYFFFKK